MSKHFYCRDDARYAHPDIREYYESLRANDLKNAELQYNPDMPAEERIASAKASYEFMKSMQEATVYTDRTKQFQVPGYEGEAGAPDVHFTLSVPAKYRPNKKYSCVFLVPGGGLQSCMDFVYDPEQLADELNAIIIVASYRTINDDNGLYPAAINDLHAIYLYLVDHAEKLGIKKDAIVCMGESTGGHLILSLAHRLKANGLVPRGCLALVPIVDERAIYPSSNYVSNIWCGRDIYAYGLFWLHNMHSSIVPAEAFANHASVEECIGLPPTIIYTAEHDPGVDPSLAYASKLIEAGVYTSVHLWGGAGHEATSAKGEGYAERIQTSIRTDLMDLLKNDFRRPWQSEK